MLKKTIKYTDFADEEHTEDFYFHLSKTELVKMEVNTPGGLSEAFKKIMAGGAVPDGKLIMKTFEEFILNAFGKKSADGRKFLKNEEDLEEFRTSGAYDAIFMSLVTDAEEAAKFLNAIMPAALMEEAEAIVRQQQMDIKTPDLENPAPRIISSAALKEMELEQFKEMTEKIATGEVVVEG